MIEKLFWLCWFGLHHFHSTKRYTKEKTEDHKKFGIEITREEREIWECCRCGKIVDKPYFEDYYF